jgi:hypothetical protein
MSHKSHLLEGPWANAARTISQGGHEQTETPFAQNWEILGLFDGGVVNKIRSDHGT